MPPLPYTCFVDAAARDSLVVLLHGMFGSRLDMLPLAAALAADHDAVAFDLPGHGDAAALLPEPFIATERSDQAIQFAPTVLDALIAELESWARPGRLTFLVGYSLGARLALLAARQRPDLVSGVVAISGNPGLEDASALDERAAQDRATAALLRSFAGAEGGTAQFAAWLRHTWYAAPLWGVARPLRSEPSFDALLHRRVHGARLDTLAAVLEQTSVAAQPALWDWLARPTVDVLYVAGGDDAKYTSVARRLAALSAQAEAGESPALRVLLLPDASHNVVAQAPGGIAAASRDFLAQFMRRRIRNSSAQSPPVPAPPPPHPGSPMGSVPTGASPGTTRREPASPALSILVTGYALRPYSLPLATPLPASKQRTLTHRDGVLLLLRGRVVPGGADTGRSCAHTCGDRLLGLGDAGSTFGTDEACVGVRISSPPCIGCDTAPASASAYATATGSELVGIGDACPLPGRHEESVAQSCAELERLAAGLVGRVLPAWVSIPKSGIRSFIGVQRLSTSARCAAEMALLHLIARARGLNVGTVLARSGSGGRPAEHSHVRINGLASLAEVEAGWAVDEVGEGAPAASAAAIAASSAVGVSEAGSGVSDRLEPLTMAGTAPPLGPAALPSAPARSPPPPKPAVPKRPFRVLKVKVGSPGATAAAAAAEGELAGRLLRRLASRGMALRLDANRSWDWNAAVAFGLAMRVAAQEAEGVQASCDDVRGGNGVGAAGAAAGGTRGVDGGLGGTPPFGTESASHPLPTRSPVTLRALEYVEEPLLPGLAHRLSEWSAVTGLPFALDETAEEPERLTDGSLHALLQSPGCAALVLKPTLVGGVEATARLAGLAAAHGRSVTLTAAFESGVAHAHLALYCLALGGCGADNGGEGAGGGGGGQEERDARSAAGLAAPSDRDAAAAATAHGLATYERLAEDILMPPFRSLVVADLVDLRGAALALDATADAQWGHAEREHLVRS